MTRAIVPVPADVPGRGVCAERLRPADWAPMGEIMSAGIIPYRVTDDGTIRVFVAHQGGPFWEHRDEGAWSMAKGQFDPDDEEPWAAAVREFAEEIGMACPVGETVALEHVR